jgi:hypothetical protein
MDRPNAASIARRMANSRAKDRTNGEGATHWAAPAWTGNCRAHWGV